MPEGLYTAAQCKALDSVAAQELGISGIQLMARAGRACFEALLAHWGSPAVLHVFCGTGNNGGDGYIVAALAHSQRIPVTVYQLGDAQRISGDARQARDQAIDQGVDIQPFSPEQVLSDGVIVDALLGTGVQGEVREDYQQAIAAINQSHLPVLAVDMPSGLCSDTGTLRGTAVKADVTLTFIALKRGLFTGSAADVSGTVELRDLAVPASAYEKVSPQCWRAELDWARSHLPERAATAHKGQAGRVLVLGGDYGLGGAGILAAQAAARSGAGLIDLATRAEHVSASLVRCPEILAAAVGGPDDVVAAVKEADILVIGPGLGRSPWSEQLFRFSARSEKPQVVDADGLNMLARGDLLDIAPKALRVLTPHPGEAARLLQTDVPAVQADRFGAAKALVERFGGVVVLKGAGTVVSDGDVTLVCDVGCAGMASGGMGDVLSGVIAALLAQGMTPLAAAVLGVQVQGLAGERAAQQGQRGLLASDLLDQIRILLG